MSNEYERKDDLQLDEKARDQLEAGAEEDELRHVIANSVIQRWSAASIRLYLSVFCACCCAFANGFDGSLMTALIAMPHWQNDMRNHATGKEPGSKGMIISVVFSLYTVGSMVGAPVAAWLSDTYGRRKSMFVGAWVIIVGMILGATANRISQFVVARFVLGFGISIMTVAAPAYSMEIAPPQWRGRCTGIYNCGWFGGSIPAAAVTFGASYINSDMQWRLPTILQAVACLIVIVLVFVVPESPRYLLAQGRREEAHAFLTKYHGGGNPNDPLVLFELREMDAALSEADRIDQRWWDYRPLFLTRGGRWRMVQVLMISIFGQFSGNGLGYFNTVIFEQLGVNTVAKQLGYNLLNQCISAFCALCAASLTDRMPRRAILPWGTLCCALMLGLNAGLSKVMDDQQHKFPDGSHNPAGDSSFNLSIGKAALAFYFLFNCIYSFTYTPLQGVIPVESLTTTMRAKGLAASGFIVSAIGFINQFAGPIGLQNLGYKYIWVFVGWDCVEALCWYLFGVEHQGHSLEELDWIYAQPNPVKTSKQHRGAISVADLKH